MTETGTTSYLDRMHLTERVNEMLIHFFKDHDFGIIEHGYDVMLREEPGMKSKLKKLKTKEFLAGLRVKFIPDFILSYNNRKKKSLFFVDTKASITPVFFKTQIDRIKKNSGENITRWDIGDIEREAWFVYNRFFPGDKVAIIGAVPYNPKLIVAEWVSNMKCLWCFKSSGPSGPIPWDCKECPIFEKSGSFGVMVNRLAGGSGTPHTNIHLGKMRSLKSFLMQEFNLNVDETWYETIEDEIKSWDLNKPAGRVNWKQFNNVVNDLKKKCPWLKNRWLNKLSKDQVKLNGFK